MHYDSPKPHIVLQVICMFVALIGSLILIVDLFIGSVLLSGSVIIFALDWLYLASDDNG